MIGELFSGNAFLWACIWQSTACVAAGLVGSFILRRRSARAHQVLFLSMVAAVIVPIMSTLVRHYQLGMFVAEPAVIQPQAEDWATTTDYKASGIISAEDIEHKPAPIEENSALAMAGSRSGKFPWSSVVLWAWVTASLVLAVRLAVAFVLGVRLLSRALPLGCQRIEEAVHLARAKLGIGKDVKVYSSQGVRSPVIWCWKRAAVLLVPSAAGRFDNRVDWTSVLCHELAHYKRRDHISGLLAELVVCIFPWHPLLWWSKSHLVSLSEQACDDWVVASGQAGTDYAESLLDLAPGGQMAFVPAVVTSKKGLAGRVRRILKDKCGNPKTGALWALAVTLLAACIAAGVAFAQTRPAKPESATQPEEKPAKSLHEAAADGDIEQVKLNLSDGADINAKDNRGRTALHRATEKGHADIVKFLIDSRADVNATNRARQTAFHRAALQGHADIVKLLIDRGADVNAKDINQTTPLHYAARYGHKQTVGVLLSKGADVNAKNRFEMTPLHEAATKGDKKTVELLLSKGAHINAKDKWGRTPLFEAMRSTAAGRKEVVELFMAQGAEVSAFHLAAYMGDIEKLKKCLQDGVHINSQADVGSTALHLAANSGETEIVEFLIIRGAQVDAKDPSYLTPPPLYYAASHNYQDIADLLLAKGADVNAKDKYGYTLLHYAIWNEDKDAVKLLISKGANVNVKPDDGYSPLTHAIWMDDKDIVQLLIDNGANVNAEDKQGGTPLWYAKDAGNKEIAELLRRHGAKAVAPRMSLHQAAAKGDIDQVKSLISKGADVNAKNKQGQTPLHVAVTKAHKALVKLLVDKGADINAKANNWYTTPLIAAIRNGHRDLAKLLIAEGADINARGRGDYTALHWAAVNRAQMTGSTEIMRLLLARGADIEASQEHGATPLACAAYDGNVETATFLIEHGTNIEAKTRYGDTPLFRAVTQGHKNMAELLLSKGADIHVKQEQEGGFNLIHMAMINNQDDMVRFLVDKGLKIPSIHVAAYLGELTEVREYLTNGADINQTDEAGLTALHCAVAGRHKDVVEYLISKGANMHAKCIDKSTPFAFADTVDMAALLLAKGADVNITTKSGQTPLHWAVNRNNHRGDKALVELLLKHGADVNAKAASTSVDWEGWSPFHVACRNGNKVIVEMLIADGADLNVKTDKGYTPLSLAKEKGHDEIVELLLKHGAKE